jgi:hypothetical protein
VIALAKGCSLELSAIYVRPIKSYLVNSFWLSGTSNLKFDGISIISLSKGHPEVKVPVLSKTTIVILLILSSTSPPLIKTPKEAAIPVPTITAVGVAKPKAQGQAMTKVDIPKLNANTNFVYFPVYSSSPLVYTKVNQKIEVIIERITIAGTKYLAIVSATP